MEFYPFFLLFVLVLCVSGVVRAETEPIAFWKLEEDGRDASGNARHAANHGVSFGESTAGGMRAARFDGRSAFLEVPAGVLPKFGSGDFSVSVWVCTEEVLDDAIGDILSKYDPETRTGLNLGIATFSGVSNSQPNYRNVHFGIDAGRIEAQWTDCGRPGNAVFVFGMAVHDGRLYAATCEPGEKESGHVYRYEGGTEWIDCGSPDSSNAVASLAVYGGKLYAGTSWYDTTGSALAASPNQSPGGKVYCYAGDRQWMYCGALKNSETGESITFGGLTVFRGKLYATTLKQDGFGLYRYEGGASWAYCGNPGRRVLNPCVFNGRLYLVSYDRPGGPFVFDGEGWSYVGSSIDPPIDQDYSFSVYEGRLHVSTWPQAYVYRMDESGTWTPCGRPENEKETMGMMVYNGKLYVGTLPSARVYRYESGDRWIPVGQPLDTSEGLYRRAWSMAVYQGKLFCGTLPSGRVYCIEAGKNVTYDNSLAPGWRHLAAVRRGGCLCLFVDGRPVSASAAFDPMQYDISNDRPLRIGFGAGDYFYGWMHYLRLYDHALSDQEVVSIYGDERSDF